MLVITFVYEMRDRYEKTKISPEMRTGMIICIAVFCFILYLLVINPYLSRGADDPSLIFIEVPKNITSNSSIIHLEDKDFINIRGLELSIKDGKILSIYLRASQNPEINLSDFSHKYGSHQSDLSQRKYLEYQGVYYYAIETIP
jgi:hypothetical protein